MDTSYDWAAAGNPEHTREVPRGKARGMGLLAPFAYPQGEAEHVVYSR